MKLFNSLDGMPSEVTNLSRILRIELTERAIIRYAWGLPLALIVMGSDLFGKKLLEWDSALDRYKKLRSKNIHKILKVSYDGLMDTEKKKNH
jgi:hypothetical protein